MVRLRRHGDRGQNQLEYIGLVALVCAFVLLIAAAPGLAALAPRFEQAVCSVLGKQCGGGPGGGPPGARQDEYYKPTLCLKAKKEETAGSEISIGFIKIGEEFGLIRRQMADDQIWLTLTDTASVGVEGGAGARGSLGKLGKGFEGGGGAEVELGGGLTFGYGDTWVFESPEEAKKFRDDIREMKARAMGRRHSPTAQLGYSIQDLIDGDSPDPPDPAITFGTVGYEAALEGSLGPTGSYTNSPGRHAKGKGRHRKPRTSTIDLNTGGEFEVGVEGDVIVADRHLNGKHTRAWTYKFNGQFTGGGQVAGVGREYVRSKTGAMRIIRNEQGELVRIDFISVSESGAGTTFGHRQGKKGGNSAGGRVSGRPTDVHVTTTRLRLRNAGQRRVAEQWLDRNGGKAGAAIGAMALAFDDKVQATDPGPDASAFNELLYREAKVMKVDYDKVTNLQEFGAEVKAGWTFGFELSLETSEQHSYDARYLGAPHDGRRDYVDFPQCEAR